MEYAEAHHHFTAMAKHRFSDGNSSLSTQKDVVVIRGDVCLGETRFRPRLHPPFALERSALIGIDPVRRTISTPLLGTYRTLEPVQVLWLLGGVADIYSTYRSIKAHYKTADRRHSGDQRFQESRCGLLFTCLHICTDVLAHDKHTHEPVSC